MVRRQTLISIIALLFVSSGVAGLIYQIAWFKYLSLFLGNTTYAQTIVLASFMGGLAIGAALWGKRADRSKNPLRLYAWLELGIGGFCLAYPWLLDVVKALVIKIVIGAELPSDSGTVLFLKLLVSLATLLPPTILMGGTLPVLVRFVSDRIEDAGKNIARLYFLNSLGAVVGSLLGGIVLIPLVGLFTTIISGVAINLLVGGIALRFSRSSIEQVEVPPAVTEGLSGAFSDRQIALAILVAGLSGFASMVYEVTWVRLLIPLLGSMTYSFTVMLVAFISGITLGSWIVSAVIHRVKNLVRFLTVCQLGVAFSMVVTLPLYGLLPYYLWNFSSYLSRTEGMYPVFLGFEFLFCIAIMIVPTIFLGMSLPIAARIASKRIEVLGASVGNIFSVNTLGTVLGSLAAGLVLIPTVGIRHAIEVGVAINLFLGMLLLATDTLIPKTRKISYIALALVPGVMYTVGASGWNQATALMSIFRAIAHNEPPPATFAEFEYETFQKKILYYREGVGATVAVTQHREGNNFPHSLYINGKVDATSIDDLPTQVLLGQYPLLFHPTAQDALVIGLGSGVTVGSLLTHPLRSVDCVEIVPEVVEAAKFFDHVNGRPLEDPRVRLVVDDALAFLTLTGKTYDVIVSEPSNPWVAGIGNLFSREFFQQCRQRLNPNGLLVQWFHTYEISDETFRLVVRTLHETFPHVTMWQSLTGDAILVSSEQPVVIDYTSLQAKFEDLAVRKDLERIAVPDVMTLLSLQVLSAESITRYAGTGAVNTENLPLLEYWAPRDFFLQRSTVELAQMDERTKPGGATILFQMLMDGYELSDREALNIGVLHTTEDRGNLGFGYQMLLSYHKKHPQDLKALESLVQANDLAKRPEEALLYLKKMVDLPRKDPNALATYAWRKFSFEQSALADISESEKLLKQCTELSADTLEKCRLMLAEIYYQVGRYRDAVEQFERALKIRELYSADPDIFEDQLRLRLAQCYQRLGMRSKALQYGIEATMVNPANKDARRFVDGMMSSIKK